MRPWKGDGRVIHSGGCIEACCLNLIQGDVCIFIQFYTFQYIAINIYCIYIIIYIHTVYYQYYCYYHVYYYSMIIIISLFVIIELLLLLYYIILYIHT